MRESTTGHTTTPIDPANSPPKPSPERNKPMVSKSVRQNRLQTFTDVFNIAYPRWEINGDATKQLTPDLVEYRTLSSYLGRCGPRDNGRVYFGLNHSWWTEKDTPPRLGLLIHELAHVKHTNHRPTFWDHVVRLYTRLKNNENETAPALGVDHIDWHAVSAWLVSDPKTSTVDNRTENAYERRLQLAEDLDYPVEEIDPFAGIQAYWIRYPDERYVGLHADELEYEAHSLEELRKWFNSPRKRTGVSLSNGKFEIDFPTAVKNGDTYRITDGHYRVGLQQYLKSSDAIVVTVTDK